MSIHFHKLRIKDVRKETPDCISICFDIPDHLTEAFEFEQGQNITIRKEFNGQETRRSYSICTSPLEKELRVAVKKVDGGLFSSFANEHLKKGDELEVLPPTGKFNTRLEPGQAKNYLAFAAGSGITPVISIIKATLQTELHSQFTLVYGNRSRNSIIFFEELEALKNEYLQRFNLIHILSRERTDTVLNYGRINREKLVELEKIIHYKKMDEIFICGPEEMIFTVKDFMEELGINVRKIHFELFTTPGQKQSTDRLQKIVSADDDQAQSMITVKLDGRSFDFKLGFNGEPILDAALKQGADLPYACKGGVCCTCKAKLLEGKVEMEVHWGLEDEEIEQGYILTCQSHPVTPKVVVDFDVK